ncbi:MAG: hypothetical protein EZS28_038497, partial [Streblomastix strix]
LDQKAGKPAELDASGVNKLDYQVYCSPKVGGFYMNWGRPSVMLGYLYNYIPKPEGWIYQNRPGYGKPQNCSNPRFMPYPWNGYCIYGLGISYPEQKCYTIQIGANVTNSVFATLFKIWCGGTSACLVTSDACKVRALQSRICACAIGFAQKSIVNAFRPVSSSMNLMIKYCISCIGGVLRAGPASASVTVISRSLANTLVSLLFASLSSISGQLGVMLRPAPSQRDGQLNGAPSPSGPHGNLKIKG